MARSEPIRSRRRRLALGLTVALALPFGVACNSLIGLSDFEKGQCAGARCPDEGGFIDQLVEDGGTDAPKDAPPDVLGTDPVSWAKWPMPNYEVADGGVPPTALPLVAGAGIVTDPNTGITWRSSPLPNSLKANEAEAACRKVTVDGPWRAPKRIELVTLLDYSKPKPFVDTTVFTDLGLDTVVTTSEVRPFAATNPARQYWVVDFGAGTVEPLAVSVAAKVLCVRATQ
jgi:hypothetical protein